MKACFTSLSPLLSVFSFLLGACIGSFLNVCIYRIPREQSILAPRSFCPSCGHPIPWWLNVPLLSYVGLGGRCRFCGGRISPRYLLVEALTAALFLLLWLRYSPSGGPRPLGLAPLDHPAIVPILWLGVSGLILGAFVDLEHLIIPDRVTLGGIVAGLGLSAAVPALHGQHWSSTGLLHAALGSALGWGLMSFIAWVGRLIFHREAMGLGDVKLLSAIGAFLGWRAVLFTIMVSSLVGSVVGLTLVVAGRKQMQSRIPYGPFLALAATLWMLWGPSWWTAYREFLMPPELPAASPPTAARTDSFRHAFLPVQKAPPLATGEGTE